METTINLNTKVKVTLTAKGAKIITDYYADMHKDYPLIPAKKFKEGDVLEEQLYYLMYMYGSSMTPFAAKHRAKPVKRRQGSRGKAASIR